MEFFFEKTKTWIHSLPWNVIFYDRNSSFAIVNHVFNHGNFGNHVIEIIDPLKKYLSMETERLVRVFHVLFFDLKHHKRLVIYIRFARSIWGNSTPSFCRRFQLKFSKDFSSDFARLNIPILSCNEVNIHNEVRTAKKQRIVHYQNVLQMVLPKVLMQQRRTH